MVSISRSKTMIDLQISFLPLIKGTLKDTTLICGQKSKSRFCGKLGKCFIRIRAICRLDVGILQIGNSQSLAFQDRKKDGLSAHIVRKFSKFRSFQDFFSGDTIDGETVSVRNQNLFGRIVGGFLCFLFGTVFFIGCICLECERSSF